jgi:hypothetical protein
VPALRFAPDDYKRIRSVVEAARHAAITGRGLFSSTKRLSKTMNNSCAVLARVRH